MLHESLNIHKEIKYFFLEVNHKGESVGDEVEYVDGDPEDQERPPDEDQQLLSPSQPVDLLPICNGLTTIGRASTLHTKSKKDE